MRPAPRFLDRVLARVGLARLTAKGAKPGRRQFAAARTDRLTADFFSGTTSANGELRTDLRRMRNRSRTMVRDSAVAKRYCALWEENVIGETAITLRPTPLAGENIDQALRDTIAAAWKRWSEPEHCTIDGRLSLTDVEQLLARSEPMDGEVLVQMVDGVGEFGFALNILDPDQLDETLNVEPTGGGPWIRQGVELSPRGRPVAYHIWDGHPNDPRRGNRRRVPAADVIHLFVPLRAGAVRGVPWLHAALQNVNMLEAYLEASLVAARVGASAMFSVQSDDDDEEQVDDVPVEMEPGKGFRVGKDEQVTLLDPKHPTTAFAEFYKACVGAIAQAGGVAYTSLSGDLAAVNYSSIRAGLLSERDRYRMMQQRMITHFCQRIYRRWLRMAQLAGALEISARDIGRAERVEWQPRGFPWVDPLKDIEALRAEIALGINSRTAAAADRGRDFEATLEAIAEETRLAKQWGVEVAGVLPAMLQEPTESTPPARDRLRVYG